MMEQVVLTIDRELRKDAGLPPLGFSHGERIDDAPSGLSGTPINTEMFRSSPSVTAHRFWPDGVPCDHPGCERHLSHPCERCGRIGARGDSALGFVVLTNEKVHLHPNPQLTRIAPLDIDPEVFFEDQPKVLDAFIAAHSHVLSSAQPTPRVVDTAKEAAETALRMKKPPAAKKENRKCKFCGAKMERWSATTLRCTACTRNEAL